MALACCLARTDRAGLLTGICDESWYDRMSGEKSWGECEAEMRQNFRGDHPAGCKVHMKPKNGQTGWSARSFESSIMCAFSAIYGFRFSAELGQAGLTCLYR